MTKLRLLVVLAFVFLSFGTTGRGMPEAPVLPHLTTIHQETTGRWNDSEKHFLTDGVVSAPVWKFEVLPGFTFLFREVYKRPQAVVLRIVQPLFTSAYFSKLFSTLIAINAP